jgi:hypothetical protein
MRKKKATRKKKRKITQKQIISGVILGMKIYKTIKRGV